MASLNTGAAFELTCGRWDCPAPTCGGLKKLAARELFLRGTEGAWERGERVRWATITPPSEGMALDQVGPGWNRVAAALRRRGVLREYALVVELQRRGEPHIHALMTGEFIPQDELSSIVRGRPGSVGRFGEVCDIKLALTTGPDSLAAYMAKAPGTGTAAELAAYASKAGVAERERMRRSSGTRTRPVRTSRLWYPGGLTGAAEAVRSEWSKGKERIGPDAEDWRVCRIRQDTGEVVWLDRGPVPSPEVDTRTGLALVPSLAPALLQAA